MKNKQDKGFTLVELLIVIVILGILATVTVFAVRGITNRGQENACDVEKRSLDTAIEAFYADNQQTDPLGFTVASAGGAATADDVLVPGYIRDDPSARWTFVPGTATAAASVTPVTTAGAACANWTA
jgi:general secretion pathway protein G